MAGSWIPSKRPGTRDQTLADFSDQGLHIANQMIIPTDSQAEAFTIGTVGALTGGIPCTINDTARFIAVADTVS